MDGDGGITQVVPAPWGGYLAYSAEGVTTRQPSPSGGINYYGTEGRNGYTAPRPADKVIDFNNQYEAPYGGLRAAFL
jgi:hypothetical protein